MGDMMFFTIRIACFMAVVFTITFFTACHDENMEQDFASYEPMANNYPQEIIITLKEATVNEDVLREVVSEIPRPALEQPNEVPLAEEAIPSIYDGTVFGDIGGIMPWHANYINSYGMLPTRYSKGPFFYSFKISPENNYYSGPVDFEDRYDDDEY
jgi:hypothetical protein